MKAAAALLLTAALAAIPTGAEPQDRAGLILHRGGTVPSLPGPAANFTGSVQIERLHTAPAPARVTVASVTFAPGARTAWHSHPLGQTLIVTSGVGWTQCGDGPVVEIRTGDVVWCPPGQRHWHGAAPDASLTHLAVYEALDGKSVDWMEYVTEDQYLAGRAKR